MNILHVTPHLGGGIGKAHAAMQAVMPPEISRTFALLEAPRDRRFADAIAGAGAKVVVAEDVSAVARLARASDIVQFEFWNHPRLFECLARCDFPPMRALFWAHISGLSPPLIPPALVRAGMRFVFTSDASFGAPCVTALSQDERQHCRAIGSGFGFEQPADAAAWRSEAIAYLGTVDFVKMSPGFFDALDAIEGKGARAEVWGAPAEAVVARHAAMRHPDRVSLRGATADPRAALSRAGIFFYPLQRGHYGTAENALIEAMSLGLVPVVLDNPAETAIVAHRETGLVADSIGACSAALAELIENPRLRERLSRNAAAWVAENRKPEHAVRDFAVLWLGLLAEEPRRCDFAHAIGGNPADWFLTTQGTAAWSTEPQQSKGTLAHFESVFAGDASLLRLRRAAG